MIKALIITILFVLIKFSSFATHIVGGELYYTYEGGNNYNITLIVYRDCGVNNENETPFDGGVTSNGNVIPPPIIGVFDNSNLLQSLELPFFLTNVSLVPISLENPCFILPPDLCIEKAIYNGNVNLPPIEGGYDLVYQRCCRNNSIINIQNAEDSGMSLYAHIPGTETNSNGENNSAQYVNTPPVALCLGAEFFFDHSASDADNDLLSYAFCPPSLGGGSDTDPANAGSPNSPQPNPPLGPEYNDVVWGFGYSDGFQIASDPGFEIDPVTGQITGTPNQIGRFAVGICVSEFRNGILLNTTIRDFQYEVTTCDPLILAAIPAQTQFCDGLSFQFENESFNASSFLWDFGVPFTTDDTTSEASPFFMFPVQGEYEVTLIANPGWPCADTVIAVYEAFPPLVAEIDDVSFNCDNGFPEYSFIGSDEYEFGFEATWNFTPDFDIILSNDPALAQEAPEPGIYNISYHILENGCEDEVEYILEVPPPPQAILEPQELFCNGFTFDFVNESLNAQSFSWDFGIINSTDDVSSLFEPSFTYSDSGVYLVTLRALGANTCPGVITQEFEIKGLLDPFFPELASQCFNDHSFDFTASGFDSQDPSIDWEFGLTADPITSGELMVNNVIWEDSGIYPVSLAITENNCTKVLTRNIEIVSNPIPDFFVFSASGCPPVSVTFTNQSTSQNPLSYLWDFGDGNTSTLTSPTHDYDTPGSYDVSLTIMSEAGCVENVSLNQQDVVNVYPVPTAGFESDHLTVHYLEPTINITDLSSGGTSCFYDFGDGNYTIECDPSHDFDDVGFLTVIQTITNDFGCEDIYEIPITVEGHLFYASNTFTPNNDGINDLFLPLVKGVIKYEFRIFNRWGEVIFETSDPLEGWNGSDNNGDYYSPNGVYAYKIVVHDLTGYPHEYDGHVSLVR